MQDSPQQASTHDHLAASKGVNLNQELTSGFAARYIRRKAKQLVGKARLTASDRPELEQDLRIALLERLPKFNPTIRHWNVFVTMVVERRIATILESRRTQKCEYSQQITSLCDRDQETGELTEEVSRCAQDQVALQHDLEAVLSQLPAELRDLCERLKFASLSQISRDLGIPRSTLNDRLKKLRGRFDAAGLKRFLKSVR